ncbi:MAG: hypothetical protein LBN99_05170 [Oscillospiraceae bacterium]|jgi:hypothetical protein|nr:hypothetical protein [Oscillospiraceae bacterium]
MALGDFQFFIRKSKTDVADEAAKYEQWAFPHGAEQRAKLEALLKELLPKESLATSLIPFLTCKELYDNVCKSPGGRSLAVDHLINVQRKYKHIISKKQMPLYVALVLADAALDPENLEYPPAAEILATAAEFEKLRELDK